LASGLQIEEKAINSRNRNLEKSWKNRTFTMLNVINWVIREEMRVTHISGMNGK
jgi:hypothetical protein